MWVSSIDSYALLLQPLPLMAIFQEGSLTLVASFDPGFCTLTKGGR